MLGSQQRRVCPSTQTARFHTRTVARRKMPHFSLLFIISNQNRCVLHSLCHELLGRKKAKALYHILTCATQYVVMFGDDDFESIEQYAICVALGQCGRRRRMRTTEDGAARWFIVEALHSVERENYIVSRTVPSFKLFFCCTRQRVWLVHSAICCIVVKINPIWARKMGTASSATHTHTHAYTMEKVASERMKGKPLSKRAKNQTQKNWNHLSWCSLQEAHPANTANEHGVWLVLRYVWGEHIE